MAGNHASQHKRKIMNYKITFNMPGRPDLTQYLIISSTGFDQAKVDARYLADGYMLEVISIEPSELQPGRRQDETNQ
jgi:hypothetical protein